MHLLLSKELKNKKILPATSASEIKTFISIIICWNPNYNAMWDADGKNYNKDNKQDKQKKGRYYHSKAKELFSDEKKLHLLPCPKHLENRQNVSWEIEDLVSKNDQQKMLKILSSESKKELSDFKKSIKHMYYAEEEIKKRSLNVFLLKQKKILRRF